MPQVDVTPAKYLSGVYTPDKHIAGIFTPDKYLAGIFTPDRYRDEGPRGKYYLHRKGPFVRTKLQ